MDPQLSSVANANTNRNLAAREQQQQKNHLLASKTKEVIPEEGAMQLHLSLQMVIKA